MPLILYDPADCVLSKEITPFILGKNASEIYCQCFCQLMLIFAASKQLAQTADRAAVVILPGSSGILHVIGIDAVV